MIEARSWNPKRELKYNQQKKFGLNTESLEAAPHRHVEGQASFSLIWITKAFKPALEPEAEKQSSRRD